MEEVDEWLDEFEDQSQQVKDTYHIMQVLNGNIQFYLTEHTENGTSTTGAGASAPSEQHPPLLERVLSHGSIMLRQRSAMRKHDERTTSDCKVRDTVAKPPGLSTEISELLLHLRKMALRRHESSSIVLPPGAASAPATARPAAMKPAATFPTFIESSYTTRVEYLAARTVWIGSAGAAP